MAMLLNKRALPQQPAELVSVNYGNPITRGLVRAVVFGPAGSVPFDLVTGTYLTTVGTGFVQDMRENSMGIRNTNETSYWTMPKRSETPFLFAFAWVGIQDGGTTQQILQDNSNTSGNIPFWRSASQWAVRIEGTNYTAAGTFNQGKLYSAVCTGGLAPISSTKLFVDGQLVISGTLPSGTAFSSPWYIHQNGNTGQGSLNTTYLLAIWDRNLTDEEATQFSLNPWQLLSNNTDTFTYLPDRAMSIIRSKRTNFTQPSENSYISSLFNSGFVWSADNSQVLSGPNITHKGNPVNPIPGIDNIGKYVKWTDVSSSTTGLNVPYPVINATNYVTLVIYAKPTTSASFTTAFSQKNSGTFTPQISVSFNAGITLSDESGSLNVYIRDTSANSFNIRATSQVDGSAHCWVIRLTSSGSNKIWRDGVLQTLATNNTISGGTYFSSSSSTTIGNLYSASFGSRFSDPLYLIAGSSDPLSDAECESISVNPWSVLQSSSSNIFTPATVGSSGNSTTTITGIALTASLGTIIASADGIVSISGISLTSNIGSITSVVSDTVSITGIILTSGIGTITPLVDDTTTLTGMGLISSLGTISAAVNSTVSITGIVLTSSLGTISAAVNSTVSITGIGLTSGIGTITAQVADAETLIGIGLTSSIGSVSASAGGSAVTSVIGIGLTSSLGSISTSVDDTVSITGIGLTSGIGSITGIVSDTVSITGIGSTSSLGSISAFADDTVSITGISLTSSLGSISTSVTDTTTLSGIGLTSSIGTILGLIDTGYTPSLRQYVPKLKYTTFNVGNKAHLTPNSGSRVFIFISPVRGIVKVASARTTTFTSGSRIT